MPHTFIRRAETPVDIEIVRGLLRDYAKYLQESAGADNMDFDKYEAELLGLPGPYTLLLAFVIGEGNHEEPAGCVALRPLQANRDLGIAENSCELKRLWVPTRFRGLGLGRKLTEFSIEEAKRQGFHTIYLDTVPGVMVAANHIYEQMGFQPVTRYNDNPVANVKFFRRSL